MENDATDPVPDPDQILTQSLVPSLLSCASRVLGKEGKEVKRQNFLIRRGMASDSGGVSGTCSTLVQTTELVMMMKTLAAVVVGVWWDGTGVG